MKLTKYQNYKNTNIHWLGDIPQHWDILPMKNLVKQIIDTEHKTVPFVEDGEHLVARTTNIKEGKLTYNKAKYTDYNGYLEWTRRAKPEEGDILFTREAPAGEACVIPKNSKLCLGQRVVLIKVYPQRINTNFCIYSIYGGLTENNIKMLSVGSTVFHFNMSDIRSLQILLPPLSEQTAIANYLDQKTAQIDKKVELLTQKIEKYKELKKSLINQTVCRGLPSQHGEGLGVRLKPSGIDWIGDIPKHWEVKRVKEMFEVGRGRAISQNELIEDGKYPVFSSQTENYGCLGYINTYDFDANLLTWTTDGVNAGTVFIRSGKFNCTNICGTL